MKDPDDDISFLNPSGYNLGGCILPGPRMVLVLLTIGLAWAIRSRTEGWTPAYLVLVPLILGIILLFVRIRWSRR